ncbi:hypothetical protein ACFPAG_10035 [Vogesella sp. GCM10023246]|uniref:Tyr recombinase domain-containing protein n=1 Tax=Vogesella oryzagri TaxID=3160864 RepID=A0ABV1M3Z6_9NEIS
MVEAEIEVICNPEYLELARIALGHFFYHPEALTEAMEVMAAQETAVRVLLAHWTRILAETTVRYRNQYQTRHTFASMLLMAGEPELTVAKLLGHATVEMIRRHYGRYIKQPDGLILRGEYRELGC